MAAPFCPNCQELLTPTDHAKNVCGRCGSPVPKYDPVVQRLNEVRQRESLRSLLPWRWDWIGISNSLAFEVFFFVACFVALVGIVTLVIDQSDTSQEARYVREGVVINGVVGKVETTSWHGDIHHTHVLYGRGGEVINRSSGWERDTTIEATSVVYSYRVGDSYHSQTFYSKRGEYHDLDQIPIRYLSSEPDKAEVEAHIAPRLSRLIVRRRIWQCLLTVTVLLLPVLIILTRLRRRTQARGNQRSAA